MNSMKNSVMLIGLVENLDKNKGMFTLSVREVDKHFMRVTCVANEGLRASQRFEKLREGDNLALEGSLRIKEYKTADSIQAKEICYVEVDDTFIIEHKK